MKLKYLFICILFISFAANAQKDLSEYSYVVVPEQFDFVKEKDKYALNTMTHFYFDKYGFNTYMSNKVPNVKRCDGLYADVLEEKAILATRIRIVLKDCNNNEVYSSNIGKSRVKDYKLAYQDALREAFESISALGVNQKDIQLYEEVAIESTQKVEPTKTVAIETKVDEPITFSIKSENGKVEATKIDEKKLNSQLPETKFSNYKKDGNTFLLRKTTEGYSLYQETSTAADGLLLVGKVIFINDLLRFINDKGASFKATFDDSLNLIIEISDVNVVYTAVN